MQFDQLSQLPELFRKRAAADGAYDRVAALVWQQAADLLDEALRATLTEVLTIAQAARAYDWHYEALRRRVSADPALNAGSPGDPRVTHEIMLRLGRGRGPRTKNFEQESRSAPGSAHELATIDALHDPAAERFNEIMVLASRVRRH
jgi:hypothetical protein